MFDNNLDTCWNSDQGLPQYIIFEFSKLIILKRIKIVFQGGFVGQDW